MLLELCVTELEDVATDSETGRSAAKPVVQESAHPYTDDSSQTGVVRIPGEISLMSQAFNIIYNCVHISVCLVFFFCFFLVC